MRRVAVDDREERFVERELAAVQVRVLREEVATVSRSLLPELSTELERALGLRRCCKPWVEMREVRQLAPQGVAPLAGCQ